MRLQRPEQQARRGMAALEVVMITALALPMAAMLFWMLVFLVRHFFAMLSHGVGWPYL